MQSSDWLEKVQALGGNFSGVKEWMSVKEVVALNLGFSDNHIRQILQSGIAESRSHGGKSKEFHMGKLTLMKLDKNSDLEFALQQDQTSQPGNESSKIDVIEGMEYSVPRAVAVLKANVSDHYRPAIVRRIVNKGKLEMRDEKIPGKSLLEHITYMHGKRFLDVLPTDTYDGIISQVSTRMDVTLALDEVVTQVMRGAVDVVGHGNPSSADRVKVVTLGDDALVDMIITGRWLTYDEISDMSSLSATTVGTKVRGGEFSTRRGKKTYAYITTDNMGEFGIQSIDGVFSDSARDAVVVIDAEVPEVTTKSVTVKFPGKDYVIDTTGRYDRSYVAAVLQKLDPVFGDKIVEQVWVRYRVQGAQMMLMPGSSLIDILRKSQSMVFIGDKFYTWLSGESAVNLTDAKEALKGEIGKPYVQTIEGVQCVSRSDLRNLSEAVQRDVHGDVLVDGADIVIPSFYAPEVVVEPEAPVVSETPAIAAIPERPAVPEVPATPELTIAKTTFEPRKSVGLTDQVSDLVDSALGETTLVEPVPVERRVPVSVPPVAVDAKVRQQRAAKRALKAALQASKVSIPLGGQSTEFYGAKDYTHNEVVGFLGRIHSSMFNVPTAEKIINAIGYDHGPVPGTEVISLVERLEGVMSMDSTSGRRQIESHGLTVDQVKKHIVGGTGKGFGVFIPGMDGVYVKRGSLASIAEILNGKKNRKKTLYVPNPTFQTVRDVTDYYQQKLKQAKVMPRGTMLEKALKCGVFNHASVDAAVTSYEAFEAAMKTHDNFDFNRVRDKMDMGWHDFIAGPMKALCEAGLAKDLATKQGNMRFVVVAKGKGNDVYKTLGLNVSV
jgi:hypothetical protein